MTLPGETLATGAAPTCNDCGATPELQVCSTPAGYYVGTLCGCGPYSRESGYYSTFEKAKQALDSGQYGRN